MWCFLSIGQFLLDPNVNTSYAFTTKIQGNGIGINGKNFNQPQDATLDSLGRFYVADTGANRILIWNNLPAVNFKAADIVIGQADMTSSSAVTNAGGLSHPMGAAYCGGKLAVADSLSNRVLIWNSIPAANGQMADVVIGQSTFVGGSSGRTLNTLSYPNSVNCGGGKLFISDSNNGRIIVYNSIPTSNGANASDVLGQSDFTSYAGSSTQTTLTIPNSAFPFFNFNGILSGLLVVDANRVLRFGPQSLGWAGSGASSVYGQNGSWTSTATNNPDIANGVKLPQTAKVIAGRRVIIDSFNNRILIDSFTP